MLEEHAKVLHLLEVAGEIVGRKKMQKIVYILQRLHVAFNQRYQFHFYGPYSEELMLEIEELVEMDFLEEVLEDKGNYSVYHYKVNEKGKEFLAHANVQLGKLHPIVSQLNQLSSRFLELLSTVFYFDHLLRVEVEEKVSTLKAKLNYTQEELEEAFLWVDKLKIMIPEPERTV